MGYEIHSHHGTDHKAAERKVGRAVKREMDVGDLTQLSRVGPEMERRLKRMGYDTLWDIAYADIDQLAEDARVSIRTAERMTDEARKLVAEWIGRPL